MNHAIDSLIRERKISPESGTSLINDSAYMYEIKKNLINTAASIFVMKRPEEVAIERQMTLGQSRIAGCPESRRSTADENLRRRSDEKEKITEETAELL